MLGLWASYDRLLVRLSRQTWVRAATEWLEGHQSVASIGLAVAHTLLVLALAGPLPSCLLGNALSRWRQALGNSSCQRSG